MTKSKTYFGLLICISWSGAVLGAVPVTSATVQPLTHVRRTIGRWLKKYQIPGAAVALYVHEQPYLLHFGYANRRQKTPVTPATVFELGSVSKLFTCLLVAQEVLRGRMDLDAAISDYLPALSANNYLKQVTLERLGTHTASLPFNAPATVKTHQDLVRHIARWQPKTIYPLHWQYSNHGIELLRLALEAVTGETWHDLVVQQILRPLQMAPIGVHVPKEYLPHYATCYDKAGRPTIRWNHRYMIGTAALRATSADMLKFLQAALSLPGTPAHLKQAMALTQTPYVQLPQMRHGLGWEINAITGQSAALNPGGTVQRLSPEQRQHPGVVLFAKTGTTHGFHTYIGVIPQRQAGIVIMLNRTLPKGYTLLKRLGKRLLLEISK